jgi:hypothetical protein
MNSVIVKFDNSKYNYQTNVSNNTTLESATKYFVNTWFNLGIYPREEMKKCTSIKFIKS